MIRLFYKRKELLLRHKPKNKKEMDEGPASIQKLSTLI